MSGSHITGLSLVWTKTLNDDGFKVVNFWEYFFPAENTFQIQGKTKGWKRTVLSTARTAGASAPMPGLLGHQDAPRVTPAGLSGGTTGTPNGRGMWLGELFQTWPVLLGLRHVCRGKGKEAWRMVLHSAAGFWVKFFSLSPNPCLDPIRESKSSKTTFWRELTTKKSLALLTA